MSLDTLTKLVAGQPVGDDTDKRRYPSREGKRAATVYIEIPHYRRLRVIAAQEDKSLQDIMVEALREFLDRREAKSMQSK